MKPNLLIIGNKQDPPSYNGKNIPLDIYVDKINSMDYVCRINRMMNYGTTTGTKVNGLYIGGWRDFDEVYHGGEHVDIIPSIPDIFVNYKCWYVNFQNIWQKYITEEQKNNMTLCFFDPGRKRMNYGSPCSSISMIDFFCNEKPWCDNYNIWFTGLDIDNRGEILKNGEPWKNTSHATGGDKEEAYIRKLIEEGKLKWLEQEIYKSL